MGLAKRGVFRNLRSLPPALAALPGRLRRASSRYARPGVNVSGRFASEKGVGEAARATIRALQAVGRPFVLNDVPDPGSANCDRRYSRFEEQGRYGINLICLHPHELHQIRALNGPTYFENRYNIGYWPWELPLMATAWSEACSQFDEIWAPSAYAAQAPAAAGWPVHVVPHALDLGAHLRLQTAAVGLPPDRFVFGFFFDCDSVVERKNPAGVIRAFQRAFPTEGEPFLYLKCSRATADVLSQLGDLIGGRRDIRIDNTILPRSAINGLYNRTDAYVSLHRAEGFGLTIAEAMAAGKPVIATGYSGNMDFMSEDNSYPVDHRLIELERDHGPYKRGGVWAEPNLDHAAGLMRQVHANRAAAAAIGLEGQTTVRRLLDPATVGAQMDKRFDEIAAVRAADNPG